MVVCFFFGSLCPTRTDDTASDKNSACGVETLRASGRLLRCPGFLRLPAEIPTAATSSPRFIRHRRRFGSSPTDFARSFDEHKVVIGCIGWRSTRNKKKTPSKWMVFLFGSPQQFRTFDDSDDFGGLFLNK